MTNPQDEIFPKFLSDTDGRTLTRGGTGNWLTLHEAGVDKLVGRLYRDSEKGIVYHKKEHNDHIFKKYDAWTIMRAIGSRVNYIIYETDDTVYELESYNLMDCTVWNHGELDSKFIVPLSMWAKTVKEGKMKRRMELFGIEWYNLLKDEIESKEFFELGRFIAEQRNLGKRIFPDKDNMFKAFSLPPSGIKVVIIGADPYYNGLADGYAFSSNNEEIVPKSLQNIFKEIEQDTGVLILDQNPNLQRWVDQGVFLLNAALSVEAGVPNSHSNIGWDKFVTGVLKKIDAMNQPIAFILWGNNAKYYKKFLKNPNHLIVTSAHPSPLSASKGFFGSKPFSKVNQYLINNRKKPIDWR